MGLGWIDFDREDRAKAMTILHMLREHIAVDELGFGIVRDAFADAFFPGTSTIQTRAKYFLLIPYILREATSGKYGFGRKEVLAQIANLEHKAAIRMFERNKDEPGLIGKTVLPKGWVARKPSDIYWNGIRTLEIYQGRNSLSEYVSGELFYRSSKGEGLGNARTEEDGTGDDVDVGFSSATGILNIDSIFRKDWLTTLQMALTKDEAKYLEDRILCSKATKDSLFAILLKGRESVGKYFKAIEGHPDSSPFELFAKAMLVKYDLSERIKRLLLLAVDFNKLVYAARVLYNKMMGNETAEEFWELIRETGFSKYANLDIVGLLDALKLPPNPKYQVFLVRFMEALKEGDIGRMKDEISRQERQLKGGRAKLDHRDKYSPQKWIGGDWLDFRLVDAGRILDDIFNGLGVKPC